MYKRNRLLTNLLNEVASCLNSWLLKQVLCKTCPTSHAQQEEMPDEACPLWAPCLAMGALQLRQPYALSSWAMVLFQQDHRLTGQERALRSHLVHFLLSTQTIFKPHFKNNTENEKCHACVWAAQFFLYHWSWSCRLKHLRGKAGNRKGGVPTRKTGESTHLV